MKDFALSLYAIFTKDISRRSVIWLITLIVTLGIGLAYQHMILSWPAPDAELARRESDIWLRLVQVRQFITTPDFFNHLVTNVNAPIGGVSTPWTRPVDFLLTAFYHFTPSGFSIEKRLMLASTWLPVLLGLGSIFFLSKAAEYKGRSALKLGLVVLCGLFSIPAFYIFVPGNADHHNLQSFLWCVIVFLFMSGQTVRNSVWMGITIGIWLWVSPEALMLIGLLYAIWGFDCLKTPDTSRYPFFASLAAFVTVTVGLCLEKPWPHSIQDVEYDTLSIVYVALMGFCFLGFTVLRFYIAPRPDIKNKLVLTSVLGLVLGGIFLALFPKFIKGPMADVDPYIFTNYLPQIAEATPLFSNGHDIPSILALPALAMLLLGYFGTRRTARLSLLVVGPFLMTLVQTRWYYYLEPASIVVIAKYLPAFVRITRQKYTRIPVARYAHPYLVIYVIYALLTLLVPTAESNEEKTVSACRQDLFDLMQSGKLETILGKESITVEISRGNLGGAVLFFTPYKLIAANYHREGTALRIKDKIFDASTADEALPYLKDRNVKALLICPSPTPTWLNGFFEKGAMYPSWIAPITPSPDGPIILKLNY